MAIYVNKAWVEKSWNTSTDIYLVEYHCCHNNANDEEKWLKTKIPCA